MLPTVLLPGTGPCIAVIVQSLGCVWLCYSIDCSTPGYPSFTSSGNLLKFMFIESMMLSNQVILCRPLLLLPSFFPSIGVFSNESAPHLKWTKYWSFSFIIGPSNEYSGLISLRIDLFDLLAVQGTLRIFSWTTIWKHQFFGSQPSLWSNSYINTWPLEKP